MQEDIIGRVQTESVLEMKKKTFLQLFLFLGLCGSLYLPLESIRNWLLSPFLSPPPPTSPFPIASATLFFHKSPSLPPWVRGRDSPNLHFNFIKMHFNLGGDFKFSPLCITEMFTRKLVNFVGWEAASAPLPLSHLSPSFRFC